MLALAGRLALAVALLSSGCCPVATEVLVELDASADVRARARTLRVTVLAQSGEVIASHEIPAEGSEWGAQPIVPASSDALDFHVQASALDADGVAIAAGSVRGRYEECRRITRTLLLEPIASDCSTAADGSPCPGLPGGSCRGGACCTGCWDGASAACVTTPTQAACGTGGEVCVPCVEGSTFCDGGRCVPDPCVGATDGTPCTGGRCYAEACCTTCQLGGRCQTQAATTCGTGGELCRACVPPADVCDAGTCIASRPIVSIGISETTACAVDGRGDLWCWGNGSAGQLARGDRRCCPSRPLRTDAGAGQWRSVDVMNGHWGHACGIQGAPGASVGSLWCWGSNAESEVGDPDAIGTDGSTLYIDLPARIGADVGGDEWQSVAGGRAATCALHLGRVHCWGWNETHRLGLPRADTPEGYAERPQPLDGAYGRVDLAYGDVGGCAIEVDGGLVCWGHNVRGELGPATSPLVPPQPVFAGTRWSDIALGSSHACGIRADAPLEGTLWCWGSNERGQLGAPGVADATTEPQQVGSEAGWTAVSADATATCAIRGRALWCWGDNDDGQLGIGMEAAALAESRTPVQVRPDIEWTLVEVGEATSCASDVRGVLWCWGRDLGGASGVYALAPEEFVLRE